VARERGRSVALAKPRRACLHVHEPTGLVVDHGQEPDRRELELARINNLHRDDVMTEHQLSN
jgi:hypothetical protein